MNIFDPEFYPTPPEVIEYMLRPYAETLDQATILEPSAGNGAILDLLCNTGVTVIWGTKRNVYREEGCLKGMRG